MGGLGNGRTSGAWFPGRQSVQILSRHTRIGAICERIGARRGRNIGVVAGAREQLEFVCYGLRDNPCAAGARAPATVA